MHSRGLCVAAGQGCSLEVSEESYPCGAFSLACRHDSQIVMHSIIFLVQNNKEGALLKRVPICQAQHPCMPPIKRWVQWITKRRTFVYRPGSPQGIDSTIYKPEEELAAPKACASSSHWSIFRFLPAARVRMLCTMLSTACCTVTFG